MARFIVDLNGGESFPIEASTPREAARMVRSMGRDIMKFNGVSTLYWVWDENEENCLYMVSTFRVGKRMVSEIKNCKNI